jgi:hypothetical protein
MFNRVAINTSKKKDNRWNELETSLKNILKEEEEK